MKPEEQNSIDKYFLGLATSEQFPPLSTPNDVTEATRNAMKFYSQLQMEDGHWGNDYGGPLFLMPGLVFTCYISNTQIPKHHKLEMIRYLTSLQTEDGGWGLHIESSATMFGTVMNYVTMRILGVSRADTRMVKARTWIEERGGAVSIPAWGKFWLCTLGLYDWEGMNPVPPELWILPYSLPVHPGRWWCHCRVVYLPMAWLYGKRASMEPTPLIKQLREELYTQVYETIDWPAHKNNVYKADSYKPHSWLFSVAFGTLSFYEEIANQKLRDYALKVTLDHIRYEDTETNGICIGPVNKAMDMLVEYWASEGKSKLFKLHQDRIWDYLWLAADGMKMQGYNGSQLWDTAFSLQAMMETGMGDEPEFRKTMISGYNYIDITQVRQNNRDRETYYRHISKGAWPFSTVDHGWPISDCTAEGFTCALLMPRALECCKKLMISEDRLFDSVNVLLSYQNQDGGWPSYENQRGPAFMELLNPADCFDGIMVDYSYVECSSACMLALLRFRKVFPEHRAQEINTAVQRGVEFLKRAQRSDGSWHGCWGVCYTYAGWFAINALTMAKQFGIGRDVEPTIKKGTQFLLSHQHEDGSWGEDFKSCVEKRWVDLPDGHVVNTSWAVLALMNLDPMPMKAIEKGIKWLVQQQLPNGDWEQTTISGVFNNNCAISYSGYKNIFPIWALGRYLSITKQENKKPQTNPKKKSK
uniref:Terpene cyclase/mutase family member n=1 Tax=Arcella intermedia TaxID=1963864 RepID=A0A6B2KZ30_9EUKA